MWRFTSGALAWIVTTIILVACAGKPGGPITLNVVAPQPSVIDSARLGGARPITLRWVRHAADTSLRAGERDAAFGVDMGDVYFDGEPGELLRQTVAGGLTAAGHQMLENADVVVVGDYDLFSVRTKTTPLYWDVVATIRTTVRVEGAPESERRSYAVERSKRTYKWPSKAIMEQVVTDALTELQRQVQTDAELTAAIARRRG